MHRNITQIYNALHMGLFQLGMRKRYFFAKNRKSLRLRYPAYCLATVLCTASVLSLNTLQPSTHNIAFKSLKLEEDLIAASEYLEKYDRSVFHVTSLAHHFTSHIGDDVKEQSKQEEDDFIKNITVQPGDSLGVVLNNSGIGRADVNKAIEALSEHFNPRHLKVGQNLNVYFKPVADQKVLDRFEIILNPIKTVAVYNKEDGFSAALEEKEVFAVRKAKVAQINGSVFGAAAKAGIPRTVVGNTIRVYSWDVDFQRDVRKGDRIEVMYENFETEDGYVAETGDLIFANLTIRGEEIPIYRFEDSEGDVDYYTSDGRSIRKALIKTPVDGARVSSGYGMRMHPILGYNKMHKGVDFAAPTGTPIYAAGDGVIERLGRNGGYGNYVRIRHNNNLKTAYAHLHKYGKGMKVGKRVKQGQVIGYVGNTGRSTGPHLHYEVLKNNRQVNPNSIDLPTGKTLAGKDLKEFKQAMRKINREYASLTNGLKYAQKGEEAKTSVN